MTDPLKICYAPETIEGTTPELLDLVLTAGGFMGYAPILHYDPTNIKLACVRVLNDQRLHRDCLRLAVVRRWTDAGALGFGVERKQRQLKEEAGEVWWQSFARWEA